MDGGEATAHLDPGPEHGPGSDAAHAGGPVSRPTALPPPPLMGTPTPVAVSQEGCPLEKTCTSGPGLLHAPAPTPLVHSCMNSHFSLETCTGLLLSLEL